MRLPRFRIRTLMISIAVLALMLTVAYQQVLLRRAAVREEFLRAMEVQAREQAHFNRVVAETQAKQAQAVLDQLSTPLDSSPKNRQP